MVKQQPKPEEVKEVKVKTVKEVLVERRDAQFQRLNVMMNNYNQLDTMIKQAQGRIDELTELINAEEEKEKVK